MRFAQGSWTSSCCPPLIPHGHSKLSIPIFTKYKRNDNIIFRSHIQYQGTGHGWTGHSSIRRRVMVFLKASWLNRSWMVSVPLIIHVRLTSLSAIAKLPIMFEWDAIQDMELLDYTLSLLSPAASHTCPFTKVVSIFLMKMMRMNSYIFTIE